MGSIFANFDENTSKRSTFGSRQHWILKNLDVKSALKGCTSVCIYVTVSKYKMQQNQIAGNSPKALTTIFDAVIHRRNQGNDLGYGNNVKDMRTIRSGLLRIDSYRCEVSSSTTRRFWVFGDV